MVSLSGLYSATLPLGKELTNFNLVLSFKLLNRVATDLYNGLLDAVRIFWITACISLTSGGRGASLALRLPCISLANLLAASSCSSPLLGLVEK